MPDIITAMDEVAATQIVHGAETTLGTVTNSGTSPLGPFITSHTVSANFSGGTVHLVPPDIVRIGNCSLSYTVHFNFSLDLNNFIAPLQFGPWTLTIGPFKVGPFTFGPYHITIPAVIVHWPVITIPVTFPDTVNFTADFRLNPHLVGSNWKVDVVIVGVPMLALSPAAAGLLTLIGATLSAVLSPIPFIGPFLAGAIGGITGTIGIAGVTGFLGQLLTPIVSGRTFTIYNQPRHFQLLPQTSPVDPAVFIDLESVSAYVRQSRERDKMELVIPADIA